MTTRSAQLFDEKMIAKIIAAAESSGVRAASGSWGVKVTDEGVRRTWADGPCCAVGLGCLYAPLTKSAAKAVLAELDDDWSDDFQEDAVLAFAKIHGVPVDYAQSVSDGYEEIGSCVSERGYAVGDAVRAAFEDVK